MLGEDVRDKRPILESDTPAVMVMMAVMVLVLGMVIMMVMVMVATITVMMAVVIMTVCTAPSRPRRHASPAAGPPSCSVVEVM
jgi:uncharacterized protein (DUF983 family)